MKIISQTHRKLK